GSHRVNRGNFRKRRNVKEQNAVADGRRDFFIGFADARKDDTFAGAAGALGAFQFPARNNIKTAALPDQSTENGKIGIGFHGVADQRVYGFESLLQLFKASRKSGMTIYIGGCSGLPDDIGYAHTFAVKFIFFIGKFRHEDSFYARALD